MKKIFSTAMAIGFFCVVAQTANAGWVDDWVSQKSSSSPSYIEGQERGYYSGGNFSVRWQDKTSYPITTTPPHIKTGCGGIDVFMGGFSFMNTDYLVKKLQAILSNAAGVAFDLALKTECEMCSNTIKNLEAISDTLNNLQMNECAAGKSLVGILSDKNGSASLDAMREKLGTAINYDKLSSGISDLWSQLTSDQRASGNVPSSGDTQSVTSGCNSAITSIFLQDGLLLANLGSQMGLPSAYTDLMRGLVGDVRLNISQSYNVSYVEPCPQNNQTDLGAVSTGNVWAKDTSESCAQVSDSNRDLTKYTTTTLTGIFEKMQTKGVLTSAETTFIDTSPIATIPVLKLAVATNTESATVGNLSDLTAKAFALQMLSDLYTRTDGIARKAKEILVRQNGATPGQSDTKCADATFAPNIEEHLTTMMEGIHTLRQSAQSSYNTSAQQFTTTLQYMYHMQQQEAYVYNEVRKRFGDYAANSAKSK
jgi:conjugative transfer pilus assembly protein TraH